MMLGTLCIQFGAMPISPSFLRQNGLVLMMTALFILLGLGTMKYWRSNQSGIDFYEFWGIAKAQQHSSYRLGSPYRDPLAYQEQLEKMSVHDAALAEAVATRPEPDVTGTPLFYYLGGLLPKSYAAALHGYRVAQWGGFLLAVVVLARPLACWWVVLMFAVALAFAADPFVLDVCLGNLNSLQLFGLVLAAAVIEDARTQDVPLTPIKTAGLAILLTLLFLVKPNIAAAASLLGLCLMVRSERSGLVTAPLAALSAGVVLWGLPCLSFGSASIWADWWNSAIAPVGRLSYSWGTGNFSLSRLLSDLVGVPEIVALASIGATLLVSLLLAALAPGSGWSREHRHQKWGRAVVGNPYLCLSLGILGMMALSPLVWNHYLVLFFAPALWLCRDGSKSGVPRACGWFGLLLIGGLPRGIAELFSVFPRIAAAILYSVSWIPLWVGTVLVLRTWGEARTELRAEGARQTA